MMRQYSPQRCRLEQVGTRAVEVGVVPVGTVCRLFGTWRPFVGRGGDAYRDTVIVEAWRPRECGAGRYCRRTGRWVNSYHAHGMFIACVRSLRTGQRFDLSDVHLQEIEP